MIRLACGLVALVCATASTGASFANQARIALPEFVPSALGRMTESGFTAGKVLHTADGGQVFGFSIDLNGDDGLLASSETVSGGNVKSSVETFSQSTATITKVVARTNTMDDFVDLGIFGGDAGLIEHEHVLGFLQIRRTFHVLNPVTGQAFTTTWTPPNRANLLIQQTADDHQSTPQAVIFGTTKSGAPLIFTSDVAANTFGHVFHLDPTLFALNSGLQLAQDVWSGQAIFGLSPDGGTVGGSVPDIEMVDLTTGHVKGFQGVPIPPFNSGFVNGIAVDAANGIACTTTELDASVEFYDLSTGSGIAVQLPGSEGNQFNSGEAVVVDPIHHLFLVAQPNGTVGPSGSVVDIYDEQGNLKKSITGFVAFGVTPELQVNPKTRVGFVSGPTPDAVTEFAY
ncbi:MAG TPA: hypothetical protein VFO25_01070 [Candidatus Eremiobacteraceae bacterium]|nr:hypothetical protein [Candidatus Eremiobacteraceae bacterium]